MNNEQVRSWTLSLYCVAGAERRCPICKRHSSNSHSDWCPIGRAEDGDDESLAGLLRWCEEFVNDMQHGKRVCRVCNAVWPEYDHPTGRAHADWCWVGQLLEEHDDA